MTEPPNNIEPANHIAVFQETTIRRTWHNEEWLFALSDVITVLTDSTDPKQYIKKMHSRDLSLAANWGTTCTPLAILAHDGKVRETNCTNTKGLHHPIHPVAQSRTVQTLVAPGGLWAGEGNRKP